MSPKLKRRLRLVVCGICVLLILVLMGWVFAPALLVVDTGLPLGQPLSPSDGGRVSARTGEGSAIGAVVVLGGEPWTRPARAAEVYREVVRVGNIEHPTSNIQHPTGPDGAGSGERGARGGVGISVFQDVNVSESPKTGSKWEKLKADIGKAGSMQQGNIQHSTFNAQPSTTEEQSGILKTEMLKNGNAAPVAVSPVVSSQWSVVGGPVVIVSGNGDCQDVRRQLEAGQVPADRILTECESKTTHENALFTVKLLRERHITNAVVVTSWFHSRRALACFRAAAPEITFYSRPTQLPPSQSRWPDRYERKRIMQEYAKVVYYWVVYGVPPWT